MDIRGEIMSRKRKLFLLVVAGIGQQSFMSGAYFFTYYYALFKEGMMLTDIQIGTIGSITGIIAVIGYLFGGILSDFFKTKTLMAIAYFLGGSAMIAMSLCPPYRFLLMIQLIIIIAFIFVYWCSMAKYIYSLVDAKTQGQTYGTFLMLAGASGIVSGVITSYIISKIGSVAGVKMLYILYGTLIIFAGIVLLLFYKPSKEDLDVANFEEDKFQLKYILDILKMPEIWLVGIMGFSGFLFCLMCTYISPILTEYFGSSIAFVTFFSTIQIQVLRLIVTPVAGKVIDKTSSMSIMKIAFAMYLLIMLGFILMPWNPNFKVLCIIIVLITSVLYHCSTPTWFTPYNEIGIPLKMRGTAIGIGSAILFSSEAYIYIIAGKLITNYGEKGYRYLFLGTIVCAIIGFITATVLQRRIDKKKAGETI